jgi:hypothetical protein
VNKIPRGPDGQGSEKPRSNTLSDPPEPRKILVGDRLIQLWSGGATCDAICGAAICDAISGEATYRTVRGGEGGIRTHG